MRERNETQITTRIHKCTDPNLTRYGTGLSCVQLVPNSEGGVWLTATNGRVVSVVTTESSLNDRDMIPEKACRGATARKPLVVEKTNTNWIRPDKPSVPISTATMFPKCPEVLKTVNTARDAHVLQIDVDLLHNLADGLTPIGERKIVTLLIDKTDLESENIVGVVGIAGIGAIMPRNLPPATSRKVVTKFEIFVDRYNEDVQVARL